MSKLEEHAASDFIDTETIYSTMLKKISETLRVNIQVSAELMADSHIEVTRHQLEGRVAESFTFALRNTILSGRPIKKSSTKTKVPLSWRDHVLERFAPLWAVKLRRRIKYRTIETAVTIYNVCPHIQAGVGTHLNFLDSIPVGIYYPEYWREP